ncbi:MAG: sigma-E factor negative regulatory protein [Sulfuricaulis sp.]
MNDEGMREVLSALVDNELDELEERRAFAALAGDVALRNTWERYHIARSALRQDLEVVVANDMSERLAKQIVSEPSVSTAFKRRRLAHLVGTFAVAASVAAIAIVGVQWLQPPASAPLTKLAANVPKHIHSGTTRWDTKEPEAENALNAYLVEHDEFASNAGIGGMMPYIRVVSYDNDNK